eukprot:TRINITY_DN2770_c0_g1_i1.p1 TRINITY_DN2770_c0_g1~~TRINITY_DN2770_c0_g1_i1.p1  ORF type:complete len:466 (+),score=226.30 TRINITY_DN2770_c0_g1_i1:49-1398(+)
MIRVGVVGLSQRTKAVLLNPIKKMAEHIKVVGVASNQKGGAEGEVKTYAQENGINNVFPSASELFNDPNIDAVFLPTESSTRSQLAMEALGAGKHVISESPTALTGDSAKQLAKEAEQKDRLLIETHHFLHHPFLKHVFSKIVSKDVLGTPLAIKINLKHGFDVSAFGSEGATLECGPHTNSVVNRIAASLFLRPAVASAYHSVGTLAKDFERQSVSHLLLVSDYNDTTVPVLVKQAVISNDPVSSIHIVGTDAEVQINNWWNINEETEAIVRRKKNKNSQAFVIERLQNPFPHADTAFDHQLGHIITAIRSKSYGEPLDQSLKTVIANAQLLEFVRGVQEDPETYRMRTAFHDKLPAHLRGFLPSERNYYQQFVNGIRTPEDNRLLAAISTFESVPPREIYTSEFLRSFQLLEEGFFQGSGIPLKDFFDKERNPALVLGKYDYPPVEY